MSKRPSAGSSRLSAVDSIHSQLLSECPAAGLGGSRNCQSRKGRLVSGATAWARHSIRRVWAVAQVLVTLSFAAAKADSPETKGLPAIPVIQVDSSRPAPSWAVMQRHLIETMNRAGVEFYRAYTRPDGTLRWKERYEGGMNSSDDAYEGFRGFSLHHILGGSKELDDLHRRAWEGITRQFSRYGQIYREFDSNWDWMHHGEGYVSFYPLGMADPYDERFRDRSIRFAAMYTGEDPEAPNYNAELRLMRASMTGSRGPKMSWTKRDWIPTNANLVYYPLPFDDIPDVHSPTGWINDHPEDDQFGRIVRTMSDRMAKGDVPINLTAAPLIANAFLYTGEEKYRRWITDYLGKWVDLTRRNHGITPDNVGLSGKIGEHMNGNWWGGYYGWKWPRGGTDIVLASLTAAKVAVLLTGEDHWLALPRSQAAVMRERGEVRDGAPMVPVRYDDTRGWHHYLRESAHPYVHFWHVSQSEQDWRQVERLSELARKRGGIQDPDLGWAEFLRGRNPGFPLAAMQNDLLFIQGKLARILNEHGDPETWFDAQWLALEPLPTDNLVRLTIGGLPVHKRGEMLHSYVRYFDPDSRVPGLPQGVAALVTSIDSDSMDLEIVNTNLFETRRVVVQGGAYGEHRITNVRREAANAEQVLAEERSLQEGVTEIEGRYFQIDLEPGAGTTVRIGLDRFVSTPSYEFPWQARGTN